MARDKVISCFSKIFNPRLNNGFSLIELMVSVAIIGILITVGKASYSSYIERVDLDEAIKDIKIVSLQITDFNLTNSFYPNTLAEIGVNPIDPWGNPYQYLAIEGKKKSGKTRKDHSLVPINSDFDLYSLGEDGKSSPPLTAKASRDDIVRAGNGKFIGLGSEY